MIRSARRVRLSMVIVAAAAAVSSLFAVFARVARAAPKDAAALKLREHAIYTDYLGTNFSGAESKLAQAIRQAAVELRQAGRPAWPAARCGASRLARNPMNGTLTGIQPYGWPIHRVGTA